MFGEFSTLKKYFSQYTISPLLQFLDLFVIKNPNYWAFTVHHIKSDQFIENARAVFEEVKSDNELTKIIFTKNKICDFKIENSSNTLIINLMSIKGLLLLLRCKVVFVTHSIAMDYSIRFGKDKFVVLKLNMKKRIVVNLWHGIPLKKLYALWNKDVQRRLDRVKFRHYERKMYSGLISSSGIDSYAMCTMFHPIKYEQMWITGLPRNDFLLKEISQLPKYIEEQVLFIQKIKRKRKLITYAPTYRQVAAVKDSEYLQFTDEQIVDLKRILVKHNAILSFRMHYFRNSSKLFNMEKYLDDNLLFDFGHNVVSEVSSVIRESDLIISDYSSIFIEALYKNIPVIGFMYDFDHYSKNQDGVLYDFDVVFPGPIVKDFSALLKSIDFELTFSNQVESEKYRQCRKIFFDNIDTNNSKRLVAKVKNEVLQFH